TSGTFSTATEGAYSVAIGGSLTLLPASWNTQPAENVTYSICATNGTPRLAAASFTFEIPATESTLLLRLEAQNRTPFGETKRVGENEKMSGR
ncbi:MAG: hypothetical protein J6U40_05655, partial [Kiritimatiellae bacterium]|nr:hypothetical protein [Kiritimatiellia bacterium]